MTTTAGGRRAPRWRPRVLPVTGLLLAAGALLALLVPGVREQLALSATHQAQRYVALSFARGDDGTVVVGTGSRTAVKVRFVVESHLASERELAYEIGVGDARRTGTVRVAPGQATEVARAVRRPAGRFDITVRLPELDQQVVAHCPGATS